MNPQELKKGYSVFYAVNGLALGILPKLLVCPRLQAEESMPCWQTAQLETIIALVLLAAAAVMGLSGRNKGRETVNTACHTVSFAAAWAGMLLPMKIIGGCANPHMLCGIAGYPAIYIICGLTAAVALAAVVTPFLQKNCRFGAAVDMEGEKI